MALSSTFSLVGSGSNINIVRYSGATKHLWVAKNTEVINTVSGHVYTCNTAGYITTIKDPSTRSPMAKFTYTRTNIINKPVSSVQKLSTPTKNNALQFSTKWTAPTVSKTSGNRYEHVRAIWYIYWQYNGAGTTKSEWQQYILGATASSSSTNVGDFAAHGGTRINRDWFYPVTTRTCSAVACAVCGTNSKGEGPRATTSYSFAKPRKPSIEFSFNKTNGEVSVRVKTNEGTDKYERYDTRLIINIRDYTGDVTNIVNTSSKSTDVTETVDLSGYGGMGYDTYIAVDVYAWARGIAGDSEDASSTFYVAFPPQPTIKQVDVSGRGANDRLVIKLNTNATIQKQVEQVKLQYLADVPYSDASRIPGTAEWKDSGIVDDAECTAMSMSVQDLIPSPGNNTFVRIKSWARNEDVLYRYSQPVLLSSLYTPAPSAQDESISILNVEASNGGTSMLVTLGWNVSGTDDSTGTELTWSENYGAWRATDGPKTFTCDWDDGEIEHEGVTYQSHTVVEVSGLEQGSVYYFRARRYLETDTATTYSPYSNTASQITTESPDGISATVERYVALGKSSTVSWDFQSSKLQTEWQVAKTDGTIIASGSGTNSACQIPAERLASMTVDNNIDMLVRVSTGSGWVESGVYTMSIVEPPTVAVTAPQTLTSQPFEFQLECDKEAAVRVVLTSNGVVGQTPTVVKRQAAGDVLYSALLNPEWEDGIAAITLDTGLDFIDNGAYTLTCTAIDEYGLESEEQSASISVDWAHKSPDPSATFEPIDEVDDIGYHRIACRITLEPPEGAASGDRYDVYRITGDGSYLIGESLEQDAVVVDEFAPFGDVGLRYRIATRTEDGDVKFNDFEYFLYGNFMRFDWDGGFLELPYNLSISDKYNKDSEVRTHMDGTKDAYWNGGIERNANYTSDIIRLRDNDNVAAVRALARYAGPVFVRMPDGCAYTANVQVNDMSTTGTVEAVSISAQEIDIVDSFRLEQ